MLETKVILSIGSNRSYEDVVNAIGWLKALLNNFRSSRLYTTPAIQGHGNPYINAVVEGSISFDIDSFIRKLKEYEILCGRNLKARQNDIVPVDIDIVIINDKVIRYRDFSQSFFQIGYSELTCTIVKN